MLSKSSTLKDVPLRHTVADGSETSTWDRVRALSCSSRDRLRPSLSSSVGSRALEEQRGVGMGQKVAAFLPADL